MRGKATGLGKDRQNRGDSLNSSYEQFQDVNLTSPDEDYSYYTDGSEQPSEDPVYYSVSFTLPEHDNFTNLNLTDQFFLNDSVCCGNDSYNGTSNDTTSGQPNPYFVWEIALISVTTVPIIFAIVFGNTLVCIAIGTDRNLKSVQNWFIASLAISDLLLGLLVMPFSLANELMGYWMFGNILCDLWLAADVLLCTASILNLCMISLDRYWSITQAVKYVRKRTPKRAACMVAIVWGLSATICLPPLIGWKQARDTSRYPLCFISEEIGYVVYSCMGSFYIPLFVMVVVYFRIYLAAKARAHRNIKKQKKPPDIEKNNKEKSTTTTSFSTSTPPKIDQKMSPNLSVIHQERETTSSEKHENFSDSESSEFKQEKHPKNIKFDNVVKSSDEKCKLLSEDTDTSVKGAQGSTVNKNIFKGKTYTSDDTDSTSEFSVPNLRQNGFRKVTKENNALYTDEHKKLLQDSDSQAESMKSSSRLATSRALQGECGASHPETDTTCTTDEEMKNHLTMESDGHKESNKLKNISTILNPNKLQKDSNRDSQRQLSYKRQRSDAEKQKRRIARAKERRATIVLGIIMAAFIICWFPFFTLYVIATILRLHLEEAVFKFFFWLGYCNSALNPVIYTIFNRDFKMAFHKILCKPFNVR